MAGVNPVATWADSNFEAQTGTVYKTNLDNSIRVGKRLADAFACHEKASPDMNVLVNPGAVLVDQAMIEQSQQTMGPFTAPTTNPRIDRIVVDALTGVASIVAGAEAASPSPPNVPDEKIPIAQVALSVGMTAILNQHITDERVGGGTGGVSVKDRVTVDTTVEATVTETNIYLKSISGGLLGTNKSLFLTLKIPEFDLHQDETCTLRFYYGATVALLVIPTLAGTAIINARGRINCELHGDGATNAQFGDIDIKFIEGAVLRTSLYSNGTSATDSTVAQDLKVTVQFSSSLTDNKIVMARAHLRKE